MKMSFNSLGCYSTARNLYVCSMEITQATKPDKKAVLRFYKSQQYSARFIGFDRCYIMRQDDTIFASVIVSAAEPSSEQYLLHALVSDKHYRGRGLASSLIKHCLSQNTQLVCFCQPSLTTLYTQHGFKQLSENDVELKLNTHLQMRFSQYRNKYSALEALIYED